ncbi:MAG: 50S ribosomal protein L13 [Candidatus Rifleibacteriota bacterium]
MKTFQPKKSDFTREWVVVDAKDMILGRLASQVAARLRGKHQPHFAPHLDCGDFVVIVNADKIKLTGRKHDNKMHYWHTGYPGAIRSKTYGQLLEEKPDRMVWLAVKRMLPRNKLRKRFLRKLKVYAGPEHPHTAQQPKSLKLGK